MSRRAKGVPSQQSTDAQWPHKVQLAFLADMTLNVRAVIMRMCDDYCRKVSGHANTQHTYEFSSQDDAWRFHDLFGGEAWTVQPIYRQDKLGWETGHIQEYRKVPRASR